MSAAEDFEQIRMQFIDPLQHDYEVIRPIVLFGETAAERSRQTGIDRTVIGDKARRFVTDGMIGLWQIGRTEPAPRKGRFIPKPLPVTSSTSSSSIRPSTCVKSSASCRANSAIRPITTPSNGFSSPMRHPSTRTRLDHLFQLCRCLRGQVDGGAHGPGRLGQKEYRRLSQTCLALMSIAFSMPLTNRASRAWKITEHGRLITPTISSICPFSKTVLDLQHEYPRAGRVRLYGILEQQRDEPLPSERTVGRAMAINRQFHGAPGPWTSARDEQPAPVSYAHLPYRPTYPHHMWFTDIRYLVQLRR